MDVEILQGISKRVHYGQFRNTPSFHASPTDATTDMNGFSSSHLGMFVSESKFQAKPSAFIPLIKNRDTPALEALITKPEVERALLARLRKKTTLYARELGMDGEPVVVSGPPSPDAGRVVKPYVNGSGKSRNGGEDESSSLGLPASQVAEIRRHKFRIEVADVERLYEDWIIPLTKEVEVSQFFISVFDSWSWVREIDTQLVGPVSPSAPRRSLGRGYRGADEALMLQPSASVGTQWSAWNFWWFDSSIRTVSMHTGSI